MVVGEAVVMLLPCRLKQRSVFAAAPNVSKLKLHIQGSVFIKMVNSFTFVLSIVSCITSE